MEEEQETCDYAELPYRLMIVSGQFEPHEIMFRGLAEAEALYESAKAKGYFEYDTGVRVAIPTEYGRAWIDKCIDIERDGIDWACSTKQVAIF